MAWHHHQCYPMIPTKIRSHNTGTSGLTMKNIQSTKPREDDQETMNIPSALENGLKTHALYAATICYNEPTGKL